MGTFKHDEGFPASMDGEQGFEFQCTCGWEGGNPLFDAHGNGFCPECDRPVDFKLPDHLR